jgi:hypothetical protein
MRHEQHDKIALEVSRRIAAELPQRPDWIEAARANLNRWKERNKNAPRLLRGYDEWLAILDRPVAEVCAVLTAETDEGQRLRQNSPFVGVLPRDQERAIEAAIRNDQRAA